jgi:hypothetical protein
MNSENMARVLQNMIEEAEENLLYLEKVHEGREHLTSRFAELKEAMDLEAELGGPLLSEDKPSVPIDLVYALIREGRYRECGERDRAASEIVESFGFQIKE